MQVTVEQDENGDLILPLPEELLKEVGWKTDDVLTWTDNEDGTYTLSKRETAVEYVLVEAVRLQRIQYIEAVPVGKSEYALDSVALGECFEFSNKEIATNVVSHRTLTAEQAIALVKAEFPNTVDYSDQDILDTLADWSAWE
jgi:hypothetical protein